MTFIKYCPNVFLIKSDTELKKGDFVEVETKYGKEIECEIFNLIAQKSGVWFYSYVRADGMNKQTYAQKKADKYAEWAQKREDNSNKYYEASREGADFLVLAEPIKVGHHSEKRHRALYARNWARMGKSVQEQEAAQQHKNKAEYWESQTGKIDLSMPESVEYFEVKLEQALARQQGLKDGSIKRDHGYSLPYASKDVKELTKKLEIAKKLWSIKND